MKIKDILTEADFDPGVKKALVKAGYKFIKGGQDQDVYLAPDGSILKIFGTGDGQQVMGEYTEGQQSFIDFAKYCFKNKNNPFLPEVGGISQFEFNGYYYLQISIERMFDFDKQRAHWLANQLEDLARDIADGYGDVTGVMRDFNYSMDDGSNDQLYKLVMYLGSEENLRLLITTIKDLAKIADANGYRLDLHSGNFMLGSDGHIVINDPFFTGSYRGVTDNPDKRSMDSDSSSFDSSKVGFQFR
jgi:hypothetical protein